MRVVSGVSILILGFTLIGCANTPRPLPYVQRPDRITPAAVEALMPYVAQHSSGLDDIDRRRAAEAQAVALEFGRQGQPTAWRNPDSGNYGETIPGPPRPEGATPSCRTFTHTLYSKGQAQTLSGRACRDGAGVWTVAS